jgi:methyl-accepting chemotaxis protein WspA
MRFTIGKKLMFSFGSIFILMLFAAGGSYYKLNELGAAQAELINARIPAYAGSYDLRVANNKVAASLTGYLLLLNDPERAAAMKQDWVQTWERMDNDIAQLKEMSSHFQKVENKERVTELQQLLPEFHQVQQQVMAMASATDAEGSRAAQALLGTKAVPLAAQVNKLALELGESIGSTMKDSEQQVEAARSATIWMLFLSSAIAVLTGSLLAFVISRGIVGGLTPVVAPRPFSPGS